MQSKLNLFSKVENTGNNFYLAYSLCVRMCSYQLKKMFMKNRNSCTKVCMCRKEYKIKILKIQLFRHKIYLNVLTSIVHRQS